MNLTQTVFLLSDEAEDFLRVLYRQTKIKNAVNLNVIAAVTGRSSAGARVTARRLHELGLVKYEKYGNVSLTAEGLQYGKTIIEKS